MIRNEDVYRIGRITKYRGICGEVELSFTDDVFDRGEADYVICRIDGILVPFFWDEYRFKNDSVAIFKFDGIDSEQDAKRLVGIEVFYPLSCRGESPVEITSWCFFTGYEVTDLHHGLLGTVSDVDESSANVLFTIVGNDDNELLIPIHPELVKDYDTSQRTMVVDLPEGLLSLND
jgi:16S rRNA processing protein RimM